MIAVPETRPKFQLRPSRASVHRYWVTSTDRDRLDDLHGDDTRLPLERDTAPASGASRNRPTCRPVTDPLAVQAPEDLPYVPALPLQPSPPAIEAAPRSPGEHTAPRPRAADSPSGLPSELIELQQAADAAHLELQQLHDHHERAEQRRVWRQAAEAAQAAITHYARTKRLNRYEVEARLRQLVRRPVH
ncbi:hypothetical protein [Streptomyces tendae]|uniref:hypothetical protein n=1 Tax=Streptomyces tendae TaxID=1932 RepID=UPI003722A61D